MRVLQKPSNIVLQFALPAIVTLEIVETLSNDFKRLISTPGAAVLLDASKVDIITTPGMQLILSLDKSLELTGGRLEIVNPSEFFVQITKALGLIAQLAKWSAQ
jgi:anti-anti-sigma regulatory factor